MIQVLLTWLNANVFFSQGKSSTPTLIVFAWFSMTYGVVELTCAYFLFKNVDDDLANPKVTTVLLRGLLYFFSLMVASFMCICQMQIQHLEKNLETP